jgi:hypothetical protein
VQHVHDELAPGEQPVRHELASPDGAGLVRHVCCFVLTAGVLLLRWMASVSGGLSTAVCLRLLAEKET